VNPLFAPDNLLYPWLEEHHQIFIANWLRAQKQAKRLTFDIGMEGVRLTPKTRTKCKAQGMDSGVPDIKIKLHKGILLHIELKKWGGTTTTAQKKEHELLRMLGHNIEIVKEKTPQRALNRIKELVVKYENA